MTPICLRLEGASLKARHTFITTDEAMWPTHVLGSKDAEIGPAFGSKGDVLHRWCWSY